MCNFSSKMKEDGQNILVNYSEYLSEDFIILVLLWGEVFSFFKIVLYLTLKVENGIFNEEMSIAFQ